MSYEDAIGYLYGLQKHGIKLGLEKPAKMLALLGNPQDSFKAVHVAGTNGKGSTSAIIAELLKSAGHKTALFTSPHLVSFTERIKINGVEITEDDVVALTEEIREILKKEAEAYASTFFEFVTAMAFLYFKRKGADWAVIETGMGGRLDATNVIRPEVSVITSIALDHKDFLGGTLREIAYEKAGIIKEGVPVVSAPQEREAMEVIKKRADEEGSPLYISGGDFTFKVVEQRPFGITFDYYSGSSSLNGLHLPLGGSYQAQNASMALKAFELIDGFISESVIKKALASVRHPGRFERIAEDVIIDGAHNPAAARALAGTIKRLKMFFNEKGASPPLALVMGVMKDKEIGGVLEPLLPLFDEIIFTAPAYDRAAPPEELQAIAESMGFRSKTAPTVREAIETARRASPRFVVVTGSFFTIGEAVEGVSDPLLKGNSVPLKGLGEWPRKP